MSLSSNGLPPLGSALCLLSAATSTSLGPSKRGHPAKEPENLNARRSKFVPERRRRRPALKAFRRFLPRNFPRASAVLGKFEGVRVRPASPESGHDPRFAMSDQILLQFEAIRMIAASLVAVAIAIAWVLAVGK
jgi:hypothetical protein